MRWGLLILILALPQGAFAQSDQCSFYDGRRIFRDWRPMSHMLIGLTYRRECNMVTQDDARAVRSIHEARGCSIDTPLGQYFTDILNAPLNPDTSHPGLALIRSRDPVGFAQFCRMAKLLPWPRESAAFLLRKPEEIDQSFMPDYLAFWNHLDAMQGELTWMMTQLD